MVYEKVYRVKEKIINRLLYRQDFSVKKYVVNYAN